MSKYRDVLNVRNQLSEAIADLLVEYDGVKFEGIDPGIFYADLAEYLLMGLSPRALIRASSTLTLPSTS